MAVDEARDDRASPPSQLDEVGRQPSGVEAAHGAYLGDATPRTEDVRVLDDLEPAERAPAGRRRAGNRRDNLGEVADEERRHRRLQASSPGSRSPVARAASSASS